VLKRQEKMNTLEIWSKYYQQLENTQYNRNITNDTELKWNFLTDKKNYRPLG